MGQTIALVPARSGSKGIAGKNFRKLGGIPLFARAALVGREVCETVVISSDLPIHAQQDAVRAACRMRFLLRPDDLAQDDTPMVAVVKHALEQIPGQPDDILVLLQPTQPFRTPARVREAITLLQSTGADSVVSVVPLPLTHHPMFALGIARGKLDIRGYFPSRRQDVEPAYIRDGTCYTFRRETVTRYGNIYGEDCRPLILEPHETCALDTELQWAEVQARWEREHA
jgi:CMP-N,N'-diacetyllegionaminic acid synthase